MPGLLGRVLDRRQAGAWRWILCLFVLLAGAGLFWPQDASAQVERVRYQAGGRYLVVEFLDDDLIHVEMSSGGPVPDNGQPLYSTPMVYKRDYPGPSRLARAGNGVWETPDVRVRVHLDTLCVTVTDLTREPELALTTACPYPIGGEEDEQGLTLTRERFTHVYGLGQEFRSPPSSDGDWMGRVRSPGNEMGNAVVDWNGGAVGNIQFPVALVAGAGTESYGLFLDHPYAQRWDLTGDPWTVQIGGELSSQSVQRERIPTRFYLMTGPDLGDVRQDYMELVGRPPVPPKAMFGLWVSEYGYDNWAEVEDKLRTLRASGFPVDGFVLDLQWFGGVIMASEKSPTGSMTWDRNHFPDPEGNVAELRDEEGVGIVLIEHSYVSKDLDIYEEMKDRDYLVRECEDCGPANMRQRYWGKGGMIDWTNEEAGAYWHDVKREPLIEDGIVGHWTDLGEPMNYDPNAWYWGFPDHVPPLHGHASVHNLFNLLWNRSIYEGYARNGHDQRPFILSRSGAPGSQRYGVALWSADIGSNLGSMAGQLNTQMHMSMSGIDYYGADIGGFHRSALSNDSINNGSRESLDELYTIWLANGAAFDVPVRPHALNLCNCWETAPDRVGDVASNLDNVRARYALIPYLYSLAHRAYLYGEPVVPPLVYYYPNDPNVRTMGDEKLLGRDLLVAAVTSFGEQAGSPPRERCVYLPAGDWIDVHTDQRYHSEGAWFGPFPTEVEPTGETPEGAMAQTLEGAPETRFRLPMFARAGAIIPRMYVDEQTMNAFGRRMDGSRRDELIAHVYADETPSAFTLFEDDGRTMAYQRGELRTTILSQVQTEDGVGVTIDVASGDYEGALPSRDNVVHLITERAGEVSEVTLAVPPLGAATLTRYETLEAFNAASSGWAVAGPNRIVAKSGEMQVTTSKVFRFSYRTPDAEALSLEDQAYLPLVLDREGLEASPCYAYRACCEQGTRCEERAYLPLMLRDPGASVGGDKPRPYG